MMRADQISSIKKRSIVLNQMKTSVSLEEAFWEALREIARERRVPISAIVSDVEDKRLDGNLSSALRLFVLNYYVGRSKAA